jgi:hypothetical protein
MAVVEQPPRGGGDVTIARTRYHARVHMAILRICNMCTLDAADRSALTVWYDLLFMDSFALCLYDTRYVGTRRVVLWLMYV